MATITAHAQPPVRVLKEVRRQFLHKAPAVNESTDIPIVHSHLIYGSSITKESLDLLKQSKRLCIEAEDMNQYFHVSSALVESQLHSQVATLNLSYNDNSCTPWEHTARKLESLGDLESATWAHRIRANQTDYVRAMSDFHELLKSNDPLLYATAKKTQRKAIMMCREIESKYAFQKYTQILKREAYELLSMSFSKDFLKEIGHTPEEFVQGVKENGIPRIFDPNDEFYHHILKGFLSYIPMLSEPIKEGEEMETRIYDQEGQLKKIRVRFIEIFEPDPEAPFHHWYLIINKPPLERSQEGAILEKENAQNIQLKQKNRKSG